MSISFTLFRKFIPLLFFAGFLQTTVQAQCVGSTLAATATTTPALCPSRGTLTVHATGGGGGYNYQITAPTIGTPQTDSVFTTLDSGTYTVQVMDSTCTFVITNVVVVNNYVPMVLTTSGTRPTCPGANDGSITATVTGGGTTGPKRYSLLIGSTVVAGPQLSNVFNGRQPGTYTVRVEDTCGEIRTNVFVLDIAIDYSFYDFVNGVFQPQSGFYNPPYPGDARGKAWPYSISCDSVATRFSAVMVPTGTLPRPVTITIQKVSTGLTVYTAIIPAGTSTNAAYTLTEAHLAKRQQYRIIYTDNCNEIDTVLYNPAGVGLAYDVSRSCTGAVLNVHAGGRDSTMGANFNLFTCRNDTFTIISGPSPSLIGTSIIDTLGEASFTGVIAGTYRVKVSGCCESDTITAIVDPAPTVAVKHEPASISIFDDACYDNTSFKYLHLSYEYVPLTSSGTIVWRLLSGPTSFTDEHNVSHTITYPITYNKIYNPFNRSEWRVNNMPQGTYVVQATDVCGTTTPNDTFAITSADVTIHNVPLVTASIVCNNASIVVSNLISGQHNTTEIVKVTNLSTNTVVLLSNFNVPHTSETVSNLLTGNYRIQVYKHISSVSYTNLISDTTCDEVFFTKDTLLLYQLPVLDSVIVNRCASNPVSNARVYGTRGNAPYRYELIAGPTNGPPRNVLQSSPIFANLPVGTYTFGFMDTCGNEVVTSMQIDTPNRMLMVNGPVNCQDSNFSIGVNPYQGFAYSWTGPVGFVNPGTPTIFFTHYDSTTQAGTYTITVSSPGYNSAPTALPCPSFTASITLDGSCNSLIVPLPIKLVDFTATTSGTCTALLRWQTASEQSSLSFIVEYSKDGTIFSTAGTVPAAGNSNTIRNYSYKYNLEQSGVTYFRLKEIDKDGSYFYSKVVSVTSACDAGGVIVSPNPVSNNLTIAGLNYGESIRIYNVMGQQVAYIKNASQSNSINTAAYTNGLYSVQVLHADGSIKANIKVIKQ